MKPWAKRVLLSVGALAVGFALCEAALRLAFPSNLAIDSTGVPKAKLYGWAMPKNAPDVFIDPDTGQSFRATTNSQGWRDVEHPFAKPPGAFRILCIGDSYTWGHAPFEETYTRRLERLLRERGFESVEVLGIGVGGWGTDQELRALELEGVRYKPDLVICQFCDNDIVDIILPRPDVTRWKHHWSKTFRYELSGGELREVKLHPEAGRGAKARLRDAALSSVVVRRAHEAILAIRRGSADPPPPAKLDPNKLPAAPERWLDLYPPGEPSPEIAEGWKLFEALLARMKKSAEGAGARFVVFCESGENGKKEHYRRLNQLVTENGAEFRVWAGGVRWPADLRRPQKELKEVCARIGAPVILPTRVYERYVNDIHPNASGNRAMAEEIADFLIREKLVEGAR